MTVRNLKIMAAVIFAATTLVPAPVLADGDPASDVLLGENVFYPYTPSVSPALQKTLTAETAAATRAHFPIKVALIASPVDLGVIPDLFDQPQKYADFLDQEISFQNKQLLLVVMPTGYGTQGLPTKATRATASLTKPTGRQSNDLARAAITAIPKLADAAGHPLHTDANTTTTSPSHGSHTVLIALLALGAIAAAVAITTFRITHPPRNAQSPSTAAAKTASTDARRSRGRPRRQR